jgi:hypothetical protein
VVRARGLLGDGRGWSRPPDRHLHAPQRPGCCDSPTASLLPTRTWLTARQSATRSSRSRSSSAPADLHLHAPRRPFRRTLTTSWHTCGCRRMVRRSSTQRCARATLWPGSQQLSVQRVARRWWTRE